MNTNPNIQFNDWEAEQMQDPEFRAAVEKLEPDYQAARRRIGSAEIRRWYGIHTGNSKKPRKAG